MNAVIGLSGLALESRDPEERQDLLKKIHGASRLLLGIINDILDYSKIDAGRLVLDDAPFELESVLGQLADMFSPSVREKGLDLILSLDPSVPRVLRGDSLRLAQVLINLVGNAVKFTERGSVELRITPAGRGCERLLFEVIDTGPGIPLSDQGKLFHAFSQGDTSTTRKFGGTGLGLVISARLVKAMGSELGFDSMPGKGSVFRFELPLKLPLTPTPPAEGGTVPEPAEVPDSGTGEFGSFPGRAPGAPAVPDLRGRRVLVAEDNDLNLEVILRLLKKTGIEAEWVENGKEALERAQVKDFDIILMDIQMPVMDGYEASRGIADLKPNVPILALTASVMDEDKARSREAGMAGHIAKPVDEAVLFGQLSRFMSGSPGSDPADSPGPVASEPLSEADLPGFDLSSGLRHAGGDPQFYRTMLSLFKNQLDQTYVNLPDTIRTAGKEIAERMTHALKGTSGLVGAMDIMEAASRADRILVEGGRVGDDLLLELERQLSRARDTLSFLGRDADTGGTTLGEVPEGKSGDEILGSLERDLLRGRWVDEGRLREAKAFMESNLGEGCCAGLWDAVRNFRYPQASALLAELRSRMGERP